MIRLSFCGIIEQKPNKKKWHMIEKWHDMIISLITTDCFSSDIFVPVIII